MTLLRPSHFFALLTSVIGLGICPHWGRAQDRDIALVKSLLAEDLANRSFSFATVIEASSGKHVIALDLRQASHQRTIRAIDQALQMTLSELNAADSPLRQVSRINEASKFFEDAILNYLNAIPGFQAEIPRNRLGIHQRSGYPDLRIVDQESKQVFYLDPKLIAQGSEKSSFRTFYFEPKNETLKVTDDAVHLLVGIEHSGKNSPWHFHGWRWLDLSTLQVRLKAEFQASNADLYPKSVLSLPDSGP